MLLYLTNRAIFGITWYIIFFAALAVYHFLESSVCLKVT